MGRALRLLAAGLLVAAVVTLAWQPARVALQTAALVPVVLGVDAGLGWLNAAPRRETVAWRTAPDGSPDLGDLWVPPSADAARPHGAILLVLGVNNVGRDYPAVVRLADGLARMGVVVLVPDSRVLLAGRVDGGEITGVITAFRYLAARPEVDPARVGMVGLSVGGALALLAAADPTIADEVRWVDAFGSFADAGRYLASVMAGAYRGDDGAPVAWQPAQLARDVALGMLLDLVDDPDERGALEAAYGPAVGTGERPTRDPTLRLETTAARAVERLLLARDLEAAEAAVRALPAAARATLDALTPAGHLDGLRARTFLMHDVSDAYVPYVESRALAAELGARAQLTEFRLFDHVEPKGVDLVGAAPEAWRLLWLVHAMLVETL